jgi:hypothetical protein
MNTTLEQVIADFRQAQDRAVATIRDDLKWKLPPSNRDWVFLCGSEGYYGIRELNGIKIYAHGYGIELKYPDLIIDFDWGEKGEGTGFDVWRLWNHCKVNERFLNECTYESIRQWLMAAHHADELKRDRLLWYRPQERQIKAMEQNKAHGEQRLTYPWSK